jgi:hypothetical protein
LAIDSGNYVAFNSEHCLQYAKLSIAHNVITVTDPDEPVASRGAIEFPNDGGQRHAVAGLLTPVAYSVPEFNRRLDDFDTGKIVAFQTTPEFTYTCGDLTKAYTNRRSGTGHKASRAKRVREMLRSLVYLPPDHLVVFDQVESFDKGFKKRWLLHTINEPTLEGALTTVERAETAFRFTAWDRRLKYAMTAEQDHPFFKEHSDCKWYGGYQPQLYRYDGIMFVRTLLPAQADIVKVGGPGKECRVNGKNRMDRKNRIVKDDPDRRPIRIASHDGSGETGAWRLEVSPREAHEADRFLHVIQVGVKSRNPTPTASRILERRHGTGLEIELGGGRKAELLFKAGVGGHISIRGGDRPVVDQALADKVLPNIPIQKRQRRGRP